MFAIMLIEWSNAGTLGGLAFPAKLMASFFQSVTARTAGFNTIDTGSLMPASLFVLGMLMFIGGSPGSTAGGIKTTTFVLMLVSIISVARRSERQRSLRSKNSGGGGVSGAGHHDNGRATGCVRHFGSYAHGAR